MEMIHSGNCDCPLPGERMRLGGPNGLLWAAAPSLALRTHGTTPWPSRFRWAQSLQRSRRSRCGALAESALHLPWPPGAPEVLAPRPPRSLLQPDFLFAASRPRLTSRAGKPRKARSFVETPSPARLRLLRLRIPPSAWEPTGAAAGHQRALRSRLDCARLGPQVPPNSSQPLPIRGAPWEQQLDVSSIFVLVA